MPWNKQMEDTSGRSQEAPLSKKEDRSLFLWVTVASEGTITSTHISLTKTSHMSLTSRGSTNPPQAQIIAVVHLSGN